MSERSSVKQYHTNQGFAINDPSEQETETSIQDGEVKLDLVQSNKKTLLEISSEHNNGYTNDSGNNGTETNNATLPTESCLSYTEGLVHEEDTGDALDLSANDTTPSHSKSVIITETPSEHLSSDDKAESIQTEQKIENTNINTRDESFGTATTDVIVTQPTKRSANNGDIHSKNNYLKIDLKAQQFPSKEFSEESPKLIKDSNKALSINGKHSTLDPNVFEEIALEDVETSTEVAQATNSHLRCADHVCCIGKFLEGLFCCKRLETY